MICLFTFVTINQQTAGLEKKTSLAWPANHDERLDGHYISVSWTGAKLGPKMYFVKKTADIFYKKEDRWGIKCLMIFLFTFVTINQQTAGLEKILESLMTSLSWQTCRGA